MINIVNGAAACLVLFGKYVHGQEMLNRLQIAPDLEHDECEAAQFQEYSMSWHIAGIFIIMLSSGVGVFTTLSLGTRARKPSIARILQILKMFGIGVIAATGWCHLIPDAFQSFTSDCLPEGWSDYGPAFVGVFALASSFIVQLIELSCGHGHSHGVPPPSPTEHRIPDHSMSGTLSDILLRHDSMHFEHHEHPEESRGLSTVILEAGILFHSLIIGLSLGVTGDFETFKVLLIAVCFHQFFEGLALGALIAKLNHSTVYKFLVMGLLYPMTTPFGMIVGMLVRNNFNENAANALLAEGIFNSLSAGILMYTTYAELLSNEITNNETFRNFRTPFKVYNMIALYMGAASMAILAHWS